MHRGLVLLALFLLFAPAPAMAQMCPIEKNPTNIELYVDRNTASGVLDATATLTVVSLAGKAAAPLPLKTVYFQECAIGNMSAAAGTCPAYSHVCDVEIEARTGLDPYVASGHDVSNCLPTGCCMQLQAKLTDSEGQAAALFPIMENVTIFAAYLGGDVYAPSNSTANYLYPPVLGALSITACWPLLLILGLLIVSMSAMGQSPLGAFDFSAIRAPKAKAVAVSPMLFAPGMAIKKAVEGTKKARQDAKNKKMEGQGLIAKEKDKNGKETGRYVITDKGKSSPIGVKADGKGGFTTGRERSDRQNREASRGGFTKALGAVGGKVGSIAYSGATGKWADAGNEKKSKAAGKLDAMRLNGEAIRDEKTGKYLAVKRDENTKQLVADPTNQGKVDALVRQANKDLGLGAFLKFGARSIGRAVDAQAWAMSAGKAGQAPGLGVLNRVPLVRLVGRGDKIPAVDKLVKEAAGKGIQKPFSVSIGASWVQGKVEGTFDKAIRKPHAEGEKGELKAFPKLVAGTAAGVGRVHEFLLFATGRVEEIKADERGKRGFELKLGPVGLLYGTSREELETQRKSSMDPYATIRRQSMEKKQGDVSPGDIELELRGRNANVDKFVGEGWVRQKGERYELTAQGKNALKEKNTNADPESENAKALKTLERWTYGNSGGTVLQAANYSTLQNIVNPPVPNTTFSTINEVAGVIGFAGIVGLMRGGLGGMVRGAVATNSEVMRFPNLDKRGIGREKDNIKTQEGRPREDEGYDPVKVMMTQDPSIADPGNTEAKQRYAFQHPEQAKQVLEGEISRARVKADNARNRAVEISSIGKDYKPEFSVESQREVGLRLKELGDQEKRLRELENLYKDVSDHAASVPQPGVVSANAPLNRYPNVLNDANRQQAKAAERERADSKGRQALENAEQNATMNQLEARMTETMANLAAMRKKNIWDGSNDGSYG